MQDIRVDDYWQITRAANGDAPLVDDKEEFLQSIKLESMTQEGDLFYDLEYGWSLLDFIHRLSEEITWIAMKERIRSKMARRTEIDISTLKVELSFDSDILYITIQIKKKTDDNIYFLPIALDRIRMEVVT